MIKLCLFNKVFKNAFFSGEEMTEKNNRPAKRINWKVVISLTAIIGGVLYLLISSTINNAQYFITVDELLANRQQYANKAVRVSGAVIGDTIKVSETDGSVSFEVANISADHKAIEENGGMAKALAEAVNDPSAAHLKVLYTGPKPDLLKDQAQAILTGTINNDNVFMADELLLKCPTKYEGAMQ